MRKEYNKVRTNLFTQVCYSNPFIKENNIDYAVDLNEYDLLIVYRSGETIIFDTFDNTYRIIFIIGDMLLVAIVTLLFF